jgi:predicted metalloprotease
MKRITALLIVILAVAAFSGVAVNDAKALNPEQTSVTGITTPVYWDLVRFWNVSNFKPSLNFYHAGGSDWMTPCGSTASSWGTQGFYCGPNSSIYLDYYQHAGNISNYRDGSVAFWLAHEFGHHIERYWGINFAQPYQELLADCFAGQYFRYGVNTSRLLNYNDYATDARSQIWALTFPDPAHGTREQRLRAFDYGYAQAGSNACISGAGSSY